MLQTTELDEEIEDEEDVSLLDDDIEDDDTSELEDISEEDDTITDEELEIPQWVWS